METLSTGFGEKNNLGLMRVPLEISRRVCVSEADYSATVIRRGVVPGLKSPTVTRSVPTVTPRGVVRGALTVCADCVMGDSWETSNGVALMFTVRRSRSSTHCSSSRSMLSLAILSRLERGTVRYSNREVP